MALTHTTPKEVKMRAALSPDIGCDRGKIILKTAVERLKG